MTSKCMNYSHSKNISVYEDRLKGYEKPVLFEVPNNMKQKEKKSDFKKATALRKINPISSCNASCTKAKLCKSNHLI